MEPKRLSRAAVVLSHLRSSTHAERAAHDNHAVSVLSRLAAPRPSQAYTIDAYTCDANLAPHRLPRELSAAVSDLPPRVHTLPSDAAAVHVRVPFPHVAPMVPSAPSRAFVSRFQQRAGQESLALAAYIVPDAATFPRRVRHAYSRHRLTVDRWTDIQCTSACFMQQRARGRTPDDAGPPSFQAELRMPKDAGDVHAIDVPENVPECMLRPAGTSIGSDPAIVRSALRAGIATTYSDRPSTLTHHYMLGHERQYSSVEVHAFRKHYDAVGATRAEESEIEASTAVADRSGLRLKQVAGIPSDVIAHHTGERVQDAGERDPMIKPHYTERTSELLASLQAFRYGLQELEHARQRRNAALSRDPADVSHLTHDRGAPSGSYAPYAT